MNGNVLLRFAVMIFGMLLAAYVMVQVLTDYRNSLSSLFKMLAVGGFVIGFLQPKLGAYTIIIVCGYLDLLKRCLLLFGQVYFVDIVTVLSVAPLMFAGICLGILFSRTRQGRLFEGVEWKLFAFTVAMLGIVLAAAVRAHGGLGGGIINGANSGAYVPWLLFAGFLFPTLRAQRAYLRFILIAFVPVALYAYKQAFFGLTGFEKMYMVSGLTQVNSITLAGLLRPFSTLNSAHSLSIMLVVLFGLSVYKVATSSKGRLAYGFLALLFLGAMIPGYTRTAWLMAMVFLGSVFFFRKAWSTKVFYACAALGFLTLILASGYMTDNIKSFSMGTNAKSTWVNQALQAETFKERVHGIHNWTSSTRLWTWFGMDTSNIVQGDTEMGTHDMLGGILVNYGGIALFVTVFAGIAFLYYAHRSVLRIRQDGDRFLGICYLGLLFGLVFTGMISGAHFNIFPINFFFWFIAGALIALVKRSSEMEAEAAREKRAKNPAPERSHGYHRGRPSQGPGQAIQPGGGRFGPRSHPVQEPVLQPSASVPVPVESVATKREAVFPIRPSGQGDPLR